LVRVGFEHVEKRYRELRPADLLGFGSRLARTFARNKRFRLTAPGFKKADSAEFSSFKMTVKGRSFGLLRRGTPRAVSF